MICSDLPTKMLRNTKNLTTIALLLQLHSDLAITLILTEKLRRWKPVAKLLVNNYIDVFKSQVSIFIVKFMNYYVLFSQDSQELNFYHFTEPPFSECNSVVPVGDENSGFINTCMTEVCQCLGDMVSILQRLLRPYQFQPSSSFTAGSKNPKKLPFVGDWCVIIRITKFNAISEVVRGLNFMPQITRFCSCSFLDNI